MKKMVFLVRVVLVGVAIFIILLSSCTKKGTAPSLPTEFQIKEYFPLNNGDEWTWKIVLDAQPSADTGGFLSWRDHTSTSKLGAKLSGPASEFSHGSAIFTRRSDFIGGPSGWDFVIQYTDDAFSNDGLGLRWHSHSVGNPFSRQDGLKDHTPITIAKAITQFGDTVITSDTSLLSTQIEEVYNWASIFESVESVITPAGIFLYCLKFKTVAFGWTGNMYGYNGTSYQWYAKGVGLVKLEVPDNGEHWLLRSAKINGKNYPFSF